jgi:hypothetical protein
MVEIANSLGMKAGVIAYDDDDPDNTKGPIDPDVFVKSWEKLGRPVDLFEVEEAVLPFAELPMVTYNVGYEPADALHQNFPYDYVYYSAPTQVLPNPSVPDLCLYSAKATPFTQAQFYESADSPITQNSLLSERKAA